MSFHAFIHGIFLVQRAEAVTYLKVHVAPKP